MDGEISDKQRILKLIECGYEIRDAWLHRDDDGSGVMRLTLTKYGSPDESAKLTVGQVGNSVEDITDFLNLRQGDSQ